MNASSLLSPLSFLISLTLLTDVPIPVSGLIDSGSSHCFLNSKLVRDFGLKTEPVSPPISLRLIDGTVNHLITEMIEIPVRFPDQEVLSISFYLTPLDSSCSAVLVCTV